MLGAVAEQLLGHGLAAFAHFGREVFAFYALEAVESSGEHEIVEHAAVDCRCRHTFHKIVDVFEAAAFLAGLYDVAHHIGSDAFDCREAEAYHTGFRNAECGERLIDVGAFHLNVHRLAFVHIECKLGDVVEVSAQHRGHELGREVGFEITGLEGYPAVACGVTFVEGVGSEFLPFAPYFFEYFGLVAFGLASG